MTQNFINYPDIDHATDGWRDTGEGGMFFYAVWNAATPAACSVDVTPSIGMADVLVAAHGPLTGHFDDQRHTWREWSNRGDYEQAYRESAISFDTVLLLGTTRISYFRDGYFAIRDLSDLTAAGSMIVGGISAAMGTEPTFASYLDT